LLSSLVAACVFCLALLAARMIYSGTQTYAFLAWNLLLAILPLVLSVMIDAAVPLGRRGPILVMGALWLVLLPNAPYLVTDFIHLEYLPPVPLWFDVLLFMSFAWTGLLLGLVSIHILKVHTLQRVGALRTWATILVVLTASSAAIYLGRFDQWNSWDIFVRPLTLLRAIFSPHAIPRAAAVTFGFALFLLVAYTCLEALIRSGDDTRPNASALGDHFSDDQDSRCSDREGSRGQEPGLGRDCDGASPGGTRAMTSKRQSE
jgi:uncharacterized membrane protein